MLTSKLKLFLSSLVIVLGAVFIAPCAYASNSVPEQVSVLAEHYNLDLADYDWYSLDTYFNGDYDLHRLYVLVPVNTTPAFYSIFSSNGSNGTGITYQVPVDYACSTSGISPIPQTYYSNTTLDLSTFQAFSLYGDVISLPLNIVGSYPDINSFSFNIFESSLTISQMFEYTSYAQDDPAANIEYGSSSFRSLFNGYFEFTYIDDDTNKHYPVQLVSHWANVGGSEIELLQLSIINLDNDNLSYNGHYLITARSDFLHDVDREYLLTAFRIMIGTVDISDDEDFVGPILYNSENTLIYHIYAYGNESVGNVPVEYTSTNRYDISMGTSVTYKGYKDSFLASQYDNLFTSPELCEGFFISYIEYYPYYVKTDSYILSGDMHGGGATKAKENTNIDDTSSSVPPYVFTGASVPADFDVNLNPDYDFSILADLFRVLFANFYVDLVLASITIGIIGYILYGKGG